MTSALAPERFTPVDEALERLEGAVSPLVGIVTRTVSTTYTTDETPLPNCACELASGRRTLGAATVEYGSGAHESALRARAAAIGEAIERYSAMFVPFDELRLTTARELGDAAVDPSRFALFHPLQHAQRGFPFVPFTEDTRTEFVQGVSLADGAPAYLPAQLVYLRQPGASRPIGYSTSSGLACAPTLGEAILAALLELVERDAVMLAWKCRLSLPLLDWSDDEALCTLDRRFFASTGLRFDVDRRELLPGRPDRDRGGARTTRIARGARRRRGSCGRGGGGMAQGDRRGLRRVPLARSPGRLDAASPATRSRLDRDVRRSHAVLRANASRRRSHRS